MLPTIQFDDKETKLLFDKELFPLKRRINQKIYTLFEQIKLRLKDTEQHKQFIFPPGTDFSTGKISQGENYVSYPWVILDFPKLYRKDDIFAFRTMFLYGHYFSFNMVLSGNAAKDFLPILLKNRNILLGEELYFSIHDDPWEHLITAEKNLAIANIGEAEWIEQMQKFGYIKISAILVSSDAAEIMHYAENTYLLMLKLLSGSTDAHP